MDIAKRNIYVFGGRILTPRKLDVLQCEPIRFSGLFVYNIPNNTWTQLMVDYKHPSAQNPEVLSIKSRVTHSMLFHHVSSYIFEYRIFVIFFTEEIAKKLLRTNLNCLLSDLLQFKAIPKIVHIRWSTGQRILNGFPYIRRRYAYGVIDNGR